MTRARRLPLLRLGVAALASCETPAPPPLDGGAMVSIQLEAPPADPTDVVVARVDGKPVWGSCVAAQADGRPDRRRDALQECLDLELAAQEAERRGLARDPDVVAALPRILAARLIDRDLRAKVRSAADLPSELVDPAFAKHAYRMHRPELRASYVTRIETGDAPPGGPADLAAKAAAQTAYAALADRVDLFPNDVDRYVRAAAAGMTVSGEHAALVSRTDHTATYYREALFGLGQVGSVAAPVRGPRGWELILYTDLLPELRTSRDALLAELFPALRLRYFDLWTNQVAKHHSIQLLVDDRGLRDALGADSEEPPARPAAGSGPPP